MKWVTSALLNSSLLEGAALSSAASCTRVVLGRGRLRVWSGCKACVAWDTPSEDRISLPHCCSSPSPPWRCSHRSRASSGDDMLRRVWKTVHARL